MGYSWDEEKGYIWDADEGCWGCGGEVDDGAGNNAYCSECLKEPEMDEEEGVFDYPEGDDEGC